MPPRASQALVVLRLYGEQALDVTSYAAGQPTVHAPRYPQAVQEFAYQIATHPAASIAWYDTRLGPFLSPPERWPDLPAHPLEVLHLSSLQRCAALVESLGLVDFSSPFLLPSPPDQRFATWLIAPAAGIGRAAVFAALGFDPRLGSLALALFECGYRGLAEGLCPYAEPRLLARPVPAAVLLPLQTPWPARAVAMLVARLYRRPWLGFWLLGRALTGTGVPLWAAWHGWRIPPGLPLDRAALADLRPPPADPPAVPPAVDVVIPTMGRPDHLLNVLRDLAAQTVPPQRVVIIEQHPPGSAYAPLPDLAAGAWPFAIQQERVAWAGACRARNQGLATGDAPWVLLLDDDVRLPVEWLAHLLAVATAYAVGAVTSATYLPQQSPPAGGVPCLWPGFAGGVSLVARPATAAVRGFDQRIEGGFGEDTDYGIQLRQVGTTIVYTAAYPVLHLKAPVGGFRYPFPHPWLADPVPPRPSPTVLYAQRKHSTPTMQAGYRLFYTLKRLTAVLPLRRPAELWRVHRQWRSAARWAAWLAAQEG